MPGKVSGGKYSSLKKYGNTYQFMVGAMKSNGFNLISVRFWSFKDGESSKARFLAKNQYTQRKPLYFENTGSASSSKIGHDFRK